MSASANGRHRTDQQMHRWTTKNEPTNYQPTNQHDPTPPIANVRSAVRLGHIHTHAHTRAHTPHTRMESNGNSNKAKPVTDEEQEQNTERKGWKEKKKRKR